MRIMIGIPARYGSTRFPGKPLAEIGERSMLGRVVDVARAAANNLQAQHRLSVEVFVTTDDDRIIDHVRDDLGVEVIKTSSSCATGSDRLLAALRQFEEWPDFVVNLQGDAPFTPVSVIEDLILKFVDAPEVEVLTPVCRLSWEGLDQLRLNKVETPFSGTTAIVDSEGRAVWFSKNIIPGIRKEDRSLPCPVLQHIGLYGYQSAALERFCSWPQSAYEQLEGLEQLRFLENGVGIQTLLVEDENMVQAGIDTPEDLARAEALLS